MDTKIPDHWKELKLEFDDLKNYKTYKELINDHDEYYNKPEKKTVSNRSNRSKISYTDVGKCKLPKTKCSIQ